MADPIKLLITDDSSAYRKILSAIISRDPEINVVGVAEHGKDCLEKIPLLKPDVVTLDIEMPVMNGIETLAAMKEKYPSIPVIMLSTLTEMGANETVKCLSLGASDFIHKVLDVSSMDQNITYIRNCVIPKIKLQYKNREFYKTMADGGVSSKAVSEIVAVPKDINLIVLGVGVGGYQAVMQMFPKIEKNSKIPMLVLCHLDQTYLQSLATELKKTVTIPIKIVEDAFPLFPRFLYLASADQTVEIASDEGKLKLAVSKKTSALDLESHEPINALFRSILKIRELKTLAILLKFSGGDGMKEMQNLRANGHFTVIQDSEMLGVGESEYANVRVPIQQMHALINTLKES